MDDLFTNGFERIAIPGVGHFPHGLPGQLTPSNHPALEGLTEP